MSRMLQFSCNVNPGMQRNDWTVLGVPFRVGAGTKRETYCVARCKCGKVSIVAIPHLKSGASRNCGCVRKTTLRASARSHGESKTPLYRVWKGMRERCQNQNHRGYHYYGGRGISVCAEWDESYQSFSEWAVANGWKKGLTVDRIDTDGNYSPWNCRIVSNQENCNNKRNNRLYECWGESKTLWHWSLDSRCVVSHFNLVGRIKQDWTILEALTVPLREQPPRLIEAFGESRIADEWAKDPRCVVSGGCLFMRVFAYGWKPERAITEPSRVPA